MARHFIGLVAIGACMIVQSPLRESPSGNRVSRESLLSWLSASPDTTIFEREFQGNLTFGATPVLGTEFTSRPSLTGTSNVTIGLATTVAPGFLGALNVQMSHSTADSSSAWVLGADESARNFNWGSMRYFGAILRMGSTSLLARTQFSFGLVGPFASYGSIGTPGAIAGASEGTFFGYDTGADDGKIIAGSRSLALGTDRTVSDFAAVATNIYQFEVFRDEENVLHWYLNEELIRSEVNPIADGANTFYLHSITSTAGGTRSWQLDWIKVMSQPIRRFS